MRAYRPPMNEYLRQKYGDPCLGCGYGWSIDPAGPAVILAGTADRYLELLVGCDGRESVPSLAWDAGSYVCHVADNTRIWAERLAGASAGPAGPVASYDEVALAVARSYAGIALAGALWSLERAVGDWQAALALVGDRSLVVAHPDQGSLSVDDLARIVAHEALHHGLDLERIVWAAPTAGSGGT